MQVIEVSSIYKIRSMSLTYIDHTQSKMMNDYKLFQVFNDTISNEYRMKSIKVLNGMTFNSPRSWRSLDFGDFDLDIAVHTKRKMGNLVYVVDADCSTKDGSFNWLSFDIINDSEFYKEMRKIAESIAKSCPR